MRKITGIIALLLCFSGAAAQVTEPSDSLELIHQTSDAKFYKYNYPSHSANGEDVVLSSLLVAWQPKKPVVTDSIESLHIFSHYTIAADRECPTSSSNTTERTLFGMLAKGKYGLGLTPAYNFISRCVIIAPDYEGYGVSKDRPHPYLSERLTAQQVIDGVEYGLALYQKHVNDERALAFRSDWRSFSFGYSQGGAVALAVHRHIEENGLSDELRFRGSICGDGPYDLIETLRYYLTDDGTSYDASTKHRQGMATLPAVVPMIIKGMLDTHPDMQGHAIEDYLSQQFLDTGIMDWIASKELTTGDMSSRWYKQLQAGLDANGRHYTPQQMAELFYSPSGNSVWAKLDKLFTPEFYAYIKDNANFGNAGPATTTAETPQLQAFLDLHRALADNNLCLGWKPQHRIQFVHSRGDMVVPFGNWLSFRDAHLDDEGEYFRIDDSLSPLDHVEVGTRFFVSLVSGGYGEVFAWLDASPDPTALQPVFASSRTAAPDWFTLDGRRLSARPKAKGIYIHGGRKVLVK